MSCTASSSSCRATLGGTLLLQHSIEAMSLRAQSGMTDRARATAQGRVTTMQEVAVAKLGCCRTIRQVSMRVLNLRSLVKRGDVGLCKGSEVEQVLAQVRAEGLPVFQTAGMSCQCKPVC